MWNVSTLCVPPGDPECFLPFFLCTCDFQNCLSFTESPSTVQLQQPVIVSVHSSPAQQAGRQVVRTGDAEPGGLPARPAAQHAGGRRDGRRRRVQPQLRLRRPQVQHPGPAQDRPNLPQACQVVKSCLFFSVQPHFFLFVWHFPTAVSLLDAPMAFLRLRQWVTKWAKVWCVWRRTSSVWEERHKVQLGNAVCAFFASSKMSHACCTNMLPPAEQFSEQIVRCSQILKTSICLEHIICCCQIQINNK